MVSVKSTRISRMGGEASHLAALHHDPLIMKKKLQKKTRGGGKEKMAYILKRIQISFKLNTCDRRTAVFLLTAILPSK